MYPVVSHAPCVLLLNATGSVGCSTAGERWAPLRRVDSLEDAAALDAPAALLLPASLFPALAAEYFRALSPERAEDPRSSWAPRVRGVLVEAGVEDEASACAGRPSSDEPAEASDAAAGTKKRCANARSLAEILSARAANDPRLLAASFSPGVADAADVAASSAPHAWNPNAFGGAAARFPRNVPVALLDDDGVAVARAFAGAADGAQTHYASKIRTSVRGVAFDLTMNAAASEREDSSAETSLTCLARRTCAPLGGHSAFASVPPRPDVVGDESSSAASFVLVSARLDASSLFHDAAFGANAAMSGLVAVLAAAEAFAAATRRFDASRVEAGDAPVDATPALFAAFGGEAFGFAGSRRFAREHERLESNDAGSEPSLLPDWLRGRALKAHVELGPVGFSAKTFGERSSPDEGSGASSATDSSAASSDPPPLPPRLFAHANSAAGPAADALVRTLREASAAGRGEADASSGAANLPVVRATGAPRREADESSESSESSASADSSSLGAYFPPSSADALIRRDPKAPCAYLAEHDGAVLDPFAHGAFDAGRSRVDPSRVAGAAAAVARALARLAYDGGGSGPDSDASDGTPTPTPSAAADAVASGIDDAAIRRSVDRLVDCLIDPAIGFACELAARLGAPPTNFAARETFPSRYVGVASPRDVLAWQTDASREDDDGAASDSDSDDADSFGFSSPARRSGERRALDYASDVERFARAFLETVTAAAAPDLSGDPGTRANAPASSSKPCDSSDACDEGAGERCVRVGGLGEDPRGGGGRTRRRCAFAFAFAFSPRRRGVFGLVFRGFVFRRRRLVVVRGAVCFFRRVFSPRHLAPRRLRRA
jgi:nicastrin